jgi:hypothetical protein
VDIRIVKRKARVKFDDDGLTWGARDEGYRLTGRGEGELGDAVNE